MNNNFVQALMTNAANSCLTTDNLYQAKAANLALHLENLLFKPGVDVLQGLASIREYFNWGGTLILNCASLTRNGANTFIVHSQHDGSKRIFTAAAIIKLILSLNPDKVILPNISRDYINSLNKNSNYYLPAENYIDGFGIYSSSLMREEQIAKFIEQHHSIPKYIQGDFNVDLFNKFHNIENLYLETTKITDDAYSGLVYRDKTPLNILSVHSKQDFRVVDANCNCYTCSTGYTVAYLHHLFKHTPLLCQRLLGLHNVFCVSHLP